MSLPFEKKDTVLPRGVNGIFFRECSKSYKLAMFHLRMIKFFVATKVRFLNTRMQTSVYVIKHTKSRNARTKAFAAFFLRAHQAIKYCFIAKKRTRIVDSSFMVLYLCNIDR